MKNHLKKYFSRLYKLHKKYGDVIESEIKEARKYHKKFKRKQSGMVKLATQRTLNPSSVGSNPTPRTGI